MGRFGETGEKGAMAITLETSNHSRSGRVTTIFHVVNQAYNIYSIREEGSLFNSLVVTLRFPMTHKCTIYLI